jgi:hypothetical protein
MPPSPTKNASRTVTPTFRPTTPEPTNTPLYRATRIDAKDYYLNTGQHLILLPGDTFTLYRLEDDDGELAIDNPGVLQVLDDPTGHIVRLKGIGIGEAFVSSFVVFPCPPGGGCEPPWDFTYVWLTVMNP